MKIHCPHLSQFSSVKHAFFEADSELLSSRRDWGMEMMTGSSLPLVTLNQVHGTKVVRIENSGREQEADGLVTHIKGIALGILTADCGPVLFYDPIAEVIGACHAGWRGARQGILQSTLKEMEELGAKRSQIYATIGPTIQQVNYEVGSEFPELIGGVYEDYFYPSRTSGFHYFNLPLYIQSQLLKEELAQVHDLAVNTFTGPFSSRRRFLSEKSEVSKFSNLSAIAII
ncbi:MAG: polyphenol oxidase family protein [Alphaproteobacteria bacterium]|nr:polyphenol oxidase family protein [Alphaproteobacteria bacterium]